MKDIHTQRVAFRNNSTRYRKKFGYSVIDTAEEGGDSDSEKGQTAASNSPKKRATRSETESVSSKYICFICNTVRSSDKHPYDEGGLRRCDTDSTASKLFARKELLLKEKTHRFFVSARRLDLLLSGQAHDIFAVDIFYHQSCYIKFAIKPLSQREREEDEKKGKEEDVINAFLYRVKTSVIRDKKAFLLNELLTDIQFLSEEQHLERPAITETKSLRRLLEKELGDQIGFFPSGIYRIFHSTDINPCEYSVATLHGCGLRSKDHVRAFGRMIREKIKLKQKQRYDFPLTSEEFIKSLDEGPLPKLYNAIFYSMHDSATINEYGYAVTSRVKATKIWSLASDWESLLTKVPSPKQAIMGLVLHRLTDGHSKTDCDLMSAITALRKEPSPSTMSALMDLPQFSTGRVLWDSQSSQIEIGKHRITATATNNIASNVGTASYQLAKFLAKLLSPLSRSEYTIESTKLFLQDFNSTDIPTGYKLISFDVTASKDKCPFRLCNQDYS
eukprot:gene16362-18007_t